MSLIETYGLYDIPYAYHRGADQVPTLEDAHFGGINCGGLVILLLEQLFQTALPRNLLCYESLWDFSTFRNLEDHEPWKLGDVFYFTSVDNLSGLRRFVPQWDEQGYLANHQDHPKIHLALHTGEARKDYDPLLVHTTYPTKKVVEWPLSQFFTWRRYEAICGIRRLINRP